MASYGKKLTESNQPSTNPTKQLVDLYSGVGKQFKAKFVGCDNVSRKRGDAEAAKYAILSLKNAVKQMKTHKPRAVLGLTLKGMSIFDEQTKNTTRVPLQKVIYVAHDCEDICFFGIIVGSKESHTGYKLYCFKAEMKIAIAFVRSSQELFSLMYKLKKAKQQIREQKAGASGTEGTGQKDEDTSDPSHGSVDHSPIDNAPPPSYGSVTDQPWPSDIPKPPEANQERKQKAIDEWNRLENELSDIAKELNLGDEQKTRPEEKEGEAEHAYAQVKKKSPQESLSAGASDTNELEAIFGGELLQTSTTPNQPSAHDQIQFNLNPFQGGGNLFLPQSTASFDPQFSSPSMATTSAPTAQVEPSIAFDLTDLFQAPTGGPTGNPFTLSAPLGDPLNRMMGGPMGGPVGGPMGGPVGGPMGGPVGGPMGGPVGGPMGGPVGGPMGGPVGGPMGGPVGGPMGGPVVGRPLGPATAPMGGVFGAQPQIPAANNPFNAFPNTGAGVPQQSGDVFSSTGDTFMQSAFAQPLLPEPTLQPAVRKLGAGPPLKPESRDAFADLVSIAKSMPEKTVPQPEKNGPSPPAQPTAPKPSMMDLMRQKEQSENRINQDMLFAFGESTDSGSHQQQSLLVPSPQVPVSASASAPPPPTSSTPNWVGFDDVLGDHVLPPTQPSTSPQQNWTGFGDQFSMPTQPHPPAAVPPATTTASSWVSF